MSPAVTAVLGDEITELIAKSTVESITDPDDRERLSVRLRRAAWKGAFSSPSMSVVLTTNRPEYLDRSLRQIRAQDYPEFEIVVVTHGWHLDPNLHDTSDLEIVEVPAAVPFGQTLNIGFEQAKGDLVTKVDDDDWYSPSHLSDLACALAYSNTSLVAKSAEFVYLAELDITIRRMVNGSESYNNRNVAGGTFLIRPELLEEVGGWRDEIDRHADQALLNDLSTFGIPWYRTHGFGYVLHRRRSGHTWDAKLDYFLDSSVAQYRGLASGASLLGSE